MGHQKGKHLSLKNDRPTYIKLAEAKGRPIRRPPWTNSSDWIDDRFFGPKCIWPDPGKRSHSVSLRKYLPIAG